MYYDSPRFYYYWEKIDGASRRKKIRVRTYRRNGRDFSPDIFLEIKRKRDAVILKDRLSLNKTDIGKNWKLEIGNWKLVDARSTRVLDEYLFEAKSRCLAPKVLIVYSREPYVGKYNQNVRITFDFGIRAKRSDNLFALDGGFADVSGTKVVMEVKFKGALPFYIDRILKDFNLSRVPYSKYCLGIEACYSLPLLAMLANKSQSDSLLLRKGQLVS
ncbi:MAG: polyphosphate polymerase domain-containing protein [Parcubacteria group bacterium]|nr:polyphosphate polymerase domain-containing protein [Parcubacteria group bacterium]